MKKSLQQEIGGTHYKKYAVQPVEYFGEMWGACPFAVSATKYVVRYQDKNGIEDLRKAAHYCELAVDVIGVWTNVHNLQPRQQAVFNTFISANNLESKKLVLLKLAQYDFSGAKRDILDMIEKEGGEV